MTIKDLLSMPVGYTPQTWEIELKRKDKIKKKIRKLSELKYDYEDGYEISGNQKFKDKLDKVNHQIEELLDQLNDSIQ